jgi:hypothetical protein
VTGVVSRGIAVAGSSDWIPEVCIAKLDTEGAGAGAGIEGADGKEAGGVAIRNRKTRS